MLFADDTNIFAEDRNAGALFSKVNQGLQGLSTWFRCNRLTLNLKKTAYVFFRGPGDQSLDGLRLLVGSEEVKRVDGARFLGIWVDERLSWSEQAGRVKR